MTDYPKKLVNSLNIENGSVLADTIIPDETTKYYRVVNSWENKIQLIEIENRKGRPIFSAFKSKPFDANIEHNAIFINGRLLTRYKHQRG